MGRLLLFGSGNPASNELPYEGKAQESAALTREIAALISDDGPLGLSGIDAAAELLDPAAPEVVEPAHLLVLLTLARRFATIRRRLLGVDDESPLLKAAGFSLPDTTELVQRVSPLLGRDGRVPDDATPVLARLRRQLGRARQHLLAELEVIRRSHPKVVTDAPPTLRRDRYCVPVTSARRSELPGLVLDTSGTGITTYLEPFPIVELNNELAVAASREREEIRRILAEVSGAFAAVRDELSAGIEILAFLDAAQAKALFGRSIEGRVITPGEGDELAIRSARHPLLDHRLGSLRIEIFGGDRDPMARAIPLDFDLGEEVRTLIISGPNAGGKTIVLKTIGLMVLMAYHGIPLPVDDGTRIPIFRQLWCHIGDEQDVARDLSTFSGAMSATADLLSSGVQDSLVLYDELGAGTDPLEGAALGCALLEELNTRSCFTVVTTHLAGIAMLASNVDGMENAAMEYDEENERPTFGLRIGRPGRSRGIEIARAMGVPSTILDHAQSLLGGQHLELDRWLKRLEALEADLIEERSEIEKERLNARVALAELNGQADALARERQANAAKLIEEKDGLRRRAKQQLDAVIKTFKEAAKANEAIGKRRLQQLREQAMELPLNTPVQRECESGEISVGLDVRVGGLGAHGIVQEIRGSRIQVLVGSSKLWVQRNQLEALVGTSKTRRKAAIRLSVSNDVPRELILIGMDSEEAREEVERYLDRALAAGRASVRIVHGHGAGVLRNAVRDICKHHPAVHSFDHPPRNLGGTGATEVRLEGEGQ